MKKILSVVFAGLLLASIGASVQAAGDVKKPKDISWGFEGFTGTYDRGALQRGFQVYKEVCSACHGVKFIAFRNLLEIGFSEEEAKAIAAEYIVAGDLDQYGDETERPAKLFDYFPSPHANDLAARAANNGALPPDLSLMIKARANGADYLYSLLTGYEDGHEVASGMSYNPYFAGRQIAMGQPLFDDHVSYADGTEASLEQMSRDVVVFLAWTAEPTMEARKRAGFKVMSFLLVLTILLYFSNKKVWAGLKGKKKD
jgi:ubiquinol-cytochrome c reductase cytochrome c1 subunit